MLSNTADCGEDSRCKARGREEGLPNGFLLEEWIKGATSSDEPLYEELIEDRVSLDAVRKEEFRALMSVEGFVSRRTKKKIGKTKRKGSPD